MGADMYFLYDGAPGAIRTPDPLVRSQILYPTELRVLALKDLDYRECDILCQY